MTEPTPCPVTPSWKCPLYVESHVVRPGERRSLGCVDDPCGPCKVQRGKMAFFPAIAERARRGISLGECAAFLQPWGSA